MRARRRSTMMFFITHSPCRGRCLLGPYVAVNAVLIGLFGFAAVYHFVLWSHSRRDTVLLVFAIHCALCSLLSGCLIALVTARTPAGGQRVLDGRLELAALAQVSSV